MAAAPAPTPAAATPAATYASGTPSPAARKILDEKNIATTSVKGTGKTEELLRMML
jgi:2-oxoglutarate dehydrogenase E2 component (dihydrolipoamide succinyltransferase)